REALGGNESRAWAVEQLRNHPGIGAGILMVAAGALEALATAPASAVAAVLVADSEASGPLVDAIGRILRDTIGHEPDFRRGAERIAAEVARRLPTARELA